MATTQINRDISVTSVLGTDTLLFRRMRATEALSELSEYDLELYSERGDLKIDDALATAMTVAVDLPGGGQRYFHGIASHFAMTGRQGRFATYRVILRPWLWFLTLSSNCRIFQDKSVPQILKEVFSRYTIADVDMSHLSSAYAALTYCVQYRETDFNFVSRLMEQEGIYYFFESVEGRHTLVLADGYGAHKPAPGFEQVRYMPAEGERLGETDAIYQWSMSGDVGPGIYSLQDFDFEKPMANLLVKSTQTRKHDQSGHEYYDYPGRYSERKQGENYARNLIESCHTRYERVQGETGARGLFPGALMTLTDHPRSDQNCQVLIVRASYAVSSDTYEPMPLAQPTPVMTCVFEALSKQQEFRPARQARKPLMHGPQTAMVVGKQGEEVWTDQYGRIKVQFHWDREGQRDETSSGWIRVAQGWAGNRWGSLYTPRIGQEVVVSFLEGDPDQPLVTGSVYNADTMPPCALPEHATRSTLKSNSSKGGGGYNELRFEDKKGSEQVFLHAQKNFDQRVLQDALDWVGGDRHSKVDHDLREHVGGERHSTVVGHRNEKAGGDVSLSAGANMVIDGAMKTGVTAGGDVFIKGGENVVIEAGSAITLKVGSTYLTLNSAMVAASVVAASIIPQPQPAAASAANALAKAAATEPAGEPLLPEAADDGK